VSDILPQIQPETSGSVQKLDVPFTDFMTHAYAQGQDQSLLKSLSNITENEVNSHRDSPMLQPDDLNQKYKIGGLKFTEPMRDSEAKVMNERERNRMDQEMYLYSGASKSRFFPGMAASILGSMANPVDFGSMFIPFVGEGAKANELFESGRMVAGTLKRGLITREAIERTGVPLPKVVASMAQGMLWQGMAEVPKIYESHMEGQPMPHIGADILGQGAFAAILHGMVSGLSRLSPDTHEAMAKQAMNDFINDLDISAHKYVPLDEHVIAYQAMERDRELRERAANSVDVDAIKRNVVKERGEYPIDAALKSRNTGEIRTGPLHPLIEGYEHSSESKGNAGYRPDAEWLRGFVTDKGRFVERAEADKMTGSGGDFLAAEALHAKGEVQELDWMSPSEYDRHTDLMKQGLTSTDALNKIREERMQRREQRILANPDVKEEIERQRQEAIQQFVDDQRQKIATKVDPRVVEKAAERTIPREQAEKYNGDESHLSKSLDEDIAGMRMSGSAHRLSQLENQEEARTPDEEREYQELKRQSAMNNSKEAFQKLWREEQSKKNVANAIDTAVNCILEKIT
jgi:hypothetical protein